MYNKQSRNKIYKEVLKIYLEDIKFVQSVRYLNITDSSKQLGGLCYYFRVFLPSFHNFYCFPEIKKHKPNTLVDFLGKPNIKGLFWFATDDTKSRIKILKQAIKETDNT